MNTTVRRVEQARLEAVAGLVAGLSFFLGGLYLSFKGLSAQTHVLVVLGHIALIVFGAYFSYYAWRGVLHLQYVELAGDQLKVGGYGRDYNALLEAIREIRTPSNRAINCLIFLSSGEILKLPALYGVDAIVSEVCKATNLEVRSKKSKILGMDSSYFILCACLLISLIVWVVIAVTGVPVGSKFSR